MIRIDGVCDLTTRLNLLREATRLELLAADLRRIADEGAPTKQELDRAPILRGWSLTTIDLPCLVGMGSNHPTLRQGPIYTTDVWAIDEDACWARTLSRFYRLAEPAQSGARNDGATR
ncbi:DUF6634 family protein [Pararoseomonas indoligenes]|uniref:DUF6634 family protein n=1 Tax=Roseomonas indoligenes TaxID=2820811 RepID=UPI0038D09364